jgi:hypothetical protein
MQVASIEHKYLGTLINLHLTGTPVTDGIDPIKSSMLCNDGVITLTILGALELAKELINAVSQTKTLVTCSCIVGKEACPYCKGKGVVPVTIISTPVQEE